MSPKVPAAGRANALPRAADRRGVEPLLLPVPPPAFRSPIEVGPVGSGVAVLAGVPVADVEGLAARDVTLGVELPAADQGVEAPEASLPDRLALAEGQLGVARQHELWRAGQFRPGRTERAVEEDLVPVVVLAPSAGVVGRAASSRARSAWSASPASSCSCCAAQLHEVVDALRPAVGAAVAARPGRGSTVCAGSAGTSRKPTSVGWLVFAAGLSPKKTSSPCCRRRRSRPRDRGRQLALQREVPGVHVRQPLLRPAAARAETPFGSGEAAVRADGREDGRRRPLGQVEDARRSSLGGFSSGTPARAGSGSRVAEGGPEDADVVAAAVAQRGSRSSR